ncbi:phage tail tape measure protein [Gordonia soli]|uniref:Putative phage tail tape measure protein n=1 Tax=Gordonia soli NBRC 108243 TaxID=1223545 RepID=M0QQQ0_9ACTN|nr:phage tail tape measure protein [Gordonia soli]GAC70724.1 putative phage tail tape measure protein [Gordonia soli NBRC 108243]
MTSSVTGLHFDIIPRAVGTESMTAKLVAEMKGAGTRVGDAFGKQFSATATRGMDKAASDMAKATASMESQSLAVARSMDKEADAVGRTRVALTQLNEAKSRYASDSVKVVRAEENYERQLRATERAQRTTVVAQGEQERMAKSLVATQAAAAKEASTLQAATTKVGGAAAGVAGTMKGLGAGMLAGFGFASITAGFEGVKRAGADLEVTLNTLKQVTHATGDQMAQVSVTARQLANDASLPATSATKATEAMLELAKGGLTVDQSMQAARGTLQLAAAAQIDASQAATIQANALQTFGEKATYATTASDILANVANQSSAEIGDVAYAFQSGGAVANQFGLSMKDTAASIGLLANAGIKGSDAGTLLKSSLLALTNTTEKQNDAATKLGLEFGENGIKFNGMADLIGRLEKAHRTLGAEAYRTASAQLFGSDAVRLSGVAAQQGAKGWDAMRSAMDKQGSAADVAAAKNQGLPGQMERMENASDDLKLSIYGLISAPLSSTMEKGTTAVTALSNVLRDHKGAVQAVGGAVIGLATAWATIKVAQGIWGGLKTVVGGVSSTVRGVGAAARFTGSAVSSAASGVANLAGSAKDYWDWTGKARTKAAGDFIATKAAAAREAVSSAASWVAGGARSAGAWAAMKARAVADFAATAASSAANATRTAATWAASGARAAGAWALMRAQAAAAFIATAASATMNATKSALAWVASNGRAVASFVVLRGAQIASATASGIMTAAQWALNVAMSANPIGLIVVAIAALVGGIIYAYKHSETFRNIVKDVWNWVKLAAVAIKDTLVGAFHKAVSVVQTAWNWIKRFHTVLLIMMGPVGIAIVAIEQLVKHWHNIVDAVRSGWNWIRNVFDSIVNTIRGAVAGTWRWLYDTIIKPIVGFINAEIRGWGAVMNWLHDNVIKPVGDKISAVWNNIKTGVGNMVDWMKTQWDRIQGIVEKPARFVVETVYDKGIMPLWNGIAGVFGLGKLNAVKFAGGGVFDGPGQVPGYAPGQDTVAARLRPGMGVLVPEAARALGRFAGGGINAMLSPGERVLEDRQVDALGGPAGLWALNHMFSGGRPNANGAIPGYHFDIGGVFGSIGDAVGGAANWVKGAVGTAVDWATDPVGKIKGLFKPWIDKAMGAPEKGSDGNQFWNALTSMPKRMLDAAVAKVKDWVASALPGGFTAAPAQVVEWIKKALEAIGLPITPGWLQGYQTLIMRESGGNTGAINMVDSNAAAGHPSQGLTQTIPGTFAANHQPGTSNNITDPVANIAASMNYVRRTYGVSNDGHDLAAKVQQADASRPPKGYAGGGIVPIEVIRFDGGGVATDPTGTVTTTTTPPSGGPVNALDAVKRSTATYVWGGGNLASAVDCSGLVGTAQLVAEGQRGDHRIGATGNVLDGSWPGFVRGASANDLFKVGANAEHMAATILGTNIEARTTGERIRIGGNAVAWNDPQFTVTGHIDPKRFNPPYNPGQTTTADAQKQIAIDEKTQARITALKDQITAAQNRIAKDEINAKDADAKAAKATDEIKAAKYRADGKRFRDQITAERNKITKYEDEIKRLQNTPDATTSTSSSTSKTEDQAPVPMSWHDLGSKIGGIAFDGVAETAGIPDLLSSPFYKVPATIANAFLTHPGSLNPANVPKPSAIGPAIQKTFAPMVQTPKPKVNVIKPKLHDSGGDIPPGISLISNQTGRPEQSLSHEERELKNRVFEAFANGSGGGSDRPWVNIEQLHAGENYGAGARKIARELNQYSGQTRR